jgi:hypothetical protein
MTKTLHRVSSCELNHAQMTAVKFAEIESDTERKSTTPLHSATAGKTENPTSGFYVARVIPLRPEAMWLQKLRQLAPKHLWPDLRTPANPSTSNANAQPCLSESPGLTNKGGTESPGSSLFNRMMQITDIEFP